MIRLVDILLAFLAGEFVAWSKHRNRPTGPFLDFPIVRIFARCLFDVESLDVQEPRPRDDDPRGVFRVRRDSCAGKKPEKIKIKKTNKQSKKSTAPKKKRKLARSGYRSMRLFLMAFKSAFLIEPQAAPRAFVSPALLPPDYVSLHVDQIRVYVRRARATLHHQWHHPEPTKPST